MPPPMATQVDKNNYLKTQEQEHRVLQILQGDIKPTLIPSTFNFLPVS